MPQAPDNEIPINEPRGTRGRSDGPAGSLDALIPRARSILDQPVEPASAEHGRGTRRRRSARPRWLQRFDLAQWRARLRPFLTGLSVVLGIVVFGHLLQSHGPEIANALTGPPVEPAILNISFPSRIQADGDYVSGAIRYKDAQADVVRVTFQWIHPRQGEIHDFDVDHGATEDLLPFRWRCESPRDLAFRIVAIDAEGHRSEPRDHAFRCVATGS